MKITPVKTGKIVPTKAEKITSVLDKFIKNLKEGSVVVITSKIISICEGNVIKIGDVEKDELIKSQAQYYLPRSESAYNVLLTIRDGILIPTAGIDESNGDGYYILWPKDAQGSANKIRAYLKKRFNLKQIGVIISDSKSSPLRRGTTGLALSFSGFLALNDYIGKEDLFGHELKVTKANIADALAASAVLVMGEGDEQTPLAVIEDLSFVQFKDRNPTKAELADFSIKLEDDLYAPILTKANWLKS
jgi:dihydrofolate synthase / folylpolyglutamate synthase